MTQRIDSFGSPPGDEELTGTADPGQEGSSEEAASDPVAQPQSEPSPLQASDNASYPSCAGSASGLPPGYVKPTLEEGEVDESHPELSSDDGRYVREVAAKETAVFGALAGFEGRGDKLSITHIFQTLTTFMRLPSASGRGVLGEGRSKFTHEASPAAFPGQCPAHFACDGSPACWYRAYRILWDALWAALAMQLQLAHIQSITAFYRICATNRLVGTTTTDILIAPAAAACMSSEPSYYFHTDNHALA
eukprot:6213226-Pleurochrysis_carterae.AAC.1